MTAHIASSPLFAVRSFVGLPVMRSLPLSPWISPSIPRSTILNNIACTDRLSLWFFDRMLAFRISERIVFLMKVRKLEDVVLGRTGNKDLRSSVELITPLFRSMTRFWTSVLRVAGSKVPWFSSSKVDK